MREVTRFVHEAFAGIPSGAIFSTIAKLHEGSHEGVTKRSDDAQAEGEGLEPPHRLITGSAVFKTARLPITVALQRRSVSRAPHITPGNANRPAPC